MRKLLLIFALLSAICVQAQRVKTKIKTDKQEPEEMVAGSFMVGSQCSVCNNGYRLDQVKYSRFDKPASSILETFSVTNTTDRTLKAVGLFLEYRTPDGLQLHKRYVRIDCDIPPGETRMLSVRSFDKQKSYYYQGSAKPRKRATPFDVIFDPVAYYLSF